MKAKPTLLIIFLLPLFGVNVMAQDQGLLSRVDFGVRAGIGSSNQHWQFTIPQFEYLSGDIGWQCGYELYLTSDIPLVKTLSLSPEFGVIQKGFYSDKINLDIASAGGSFQRNTVEIMNLSLNLLAKYEIPLKSVFRPFITVGPKIDHLIQVKDWIFSVNGEMHDDYHDFIFDDYRKVVVSGVVGLGVVWNDFLSIQYQSNLPVMSSTANNHIKVKDRYHGISLGVKVLK